MKMEPCLLFGLLLTSFLLIVAVDGCNEAICGSVVSKCLITQSCQCDLKTCNCCKECFSCLGSYFSECCSCVDLCPKRNETEGSGLGTKSSVEDFKQPRPELFSALTGYSDPRDHWSVIQFPVAVDISLFDDKSHQLIYMKTAEHNTIPPNNNAMTLNCTVAFISQCISINKCKKTCRTMGSSSYRWFHDGCCECIGQYCINYGLSTSRCRSCPEPKEGPNEEYIDDYEYDDYGDAEPLEDE